MEKRVAIVSIIVENGDKVDEINAILHAYAPYIIGRMGIPYREKGVSIICVVLDAPNDVTSGLSGKLGMIKGVKTKTVTAKQSN